MSAWGIITTGNYCDSAQTFITVTDQSTSLYEPNELYEVDFAAQTVIYRCATPGPIVGAATPDEFRFSDCSVSLDLDTLTPGVDYVALAGCDTAALALADTSARLYAGYRVDSLRLRLLPPLPDGAAEYLAAQPPLGISMAGAGSPWLTLANNGPAKDFDFRQALLTARYHNDAQPRTPGLRTVEVIVFTGGGGNDTAYAYLDLPLIPDAGRDTALSLCADATALNLFGVLAPDATAGGFWLPGNGTFDPQTDPPGVFAYVAGSGGACPADTALIAVSVEALPVFSLGADTSVCAGETLTLNALPGASWQDGSGGDVFVTSDAGLYWAEVTNASGCVWRDSLILTIHQASGAQSADQVCFGQTYVWNGLAATSDTTLCVTLTAANGCDSMHCRAVTFFYPALSLDTAICAGQSLDWLGQTLDLSGIYQDTVPLGGCLTAATLTLTVLPALNTAVAATICAGGAFDFNGQNLASAGVYTATLASTTNCDSVVTLTLTVLAPAQTTLDAAICPGESYDFQGEMLSAAGIYNETLTTAAGCDSVVILNLSLLPAPQPLIAGDAMICPEGDVTSLSAAGGFSAYAWSNGANGPVVAADSPGLYAVTVTDAAGCTGVTSFAVAVWPPIAANWATADPLCPGDSNGFIELDGLAGGAPPVVFQLENEPTTPEAFFENLPAGIWTVTATDSAGCTANWEFALEDPPAWSLTLGPDATVQAGETYAIPLEIDLSGAYQYAWQPPAGLSCADCANPLAAPADSTVYAVTVTDAQGCTATDAVAVRVLHDLGIYIPTAFSPDGDGINETFSIFGDEAAVEMITLLQVYDRWGGLMFERKNFAPNDAAEGWDGTFRGKDLPTDVFVWQAEIRLKNGEVLRRKGDVTLLR